MCMLNYMFLRIVAVVSQLSHTYDINLNKSNISSF